MTSPQKAKGSGFERAIATYLTQKYGTKFIRAPGSGAYIGGKNQTRKETLHEGQIRTFKGDIIPGEGFSKLNVECKFYSDFPFHLLLNGECKVLDGWIEQMLDVADEGDCSILFMKFNRKGQYVCVPKTLEWRVSSFVHYNSSRHGEWLFIEFDEFFELNSDALRIHSS